MQCHNEGIFSKTKEKEIGGIRMMKRIGSMLCLALIMVLLSAPLCFAGTLELVDTYPKEGQGNLQNVNCGVKLYFDQGIYSKENEKANAECFKLFDEKGKEIPVIVLYDKKGKEDNMMMVLAKHDLKINAEYSLEISGDMEAKSGDTLDKDLKLNFKTRDTSKDMWANMIMMGAMFVGMLFFSSKAMKKKQEDDKKAKAKEEKVNPYKVSKETGKPVKEIVAKDEKEKAKKAAAEARKAERTKSGYTDEEEIDSWTQRVKGPKPITPNGKSYKTSKQKQRDIQAKARQEANKKGTTNPKNKSGKAKNTKK